MSGKGLEKVWKRSGKGLEKVWKTLLNKFKCLKRDKTI